jgi:hypothetical protein
METRPGPRRSQVGVVERLLNRPKWYSLASWVRSRVWTPSKWRWGLACRRPAGGGSDGGRSGNTQKDTDIHQSTPLTSILTDPITRPRSSPWRWRSPAALIDRVHCVAGRTFLSHSLSMCVYVVYVCAHVCVCVYVYVCVGVCACRGWKVVLL